ncbi:MAG: hypothetical protein QNK37_05980 [Acidobacteriota bacterium]|nr:hypothetical protein [Acidobacteriota bacterium]
MAKKEYKKPQLVARGNIMTLTKGTGGFFGDNSQAKAGGGAPS